MIRLLGPGLLGTIGAVLWVYALLDAIATDAVLVRNLPKVTWILLVIFLGPIGAIAWIGFGRPEFAGWAPGDTTRRPPSRRVMGVEDSDSWTNPRTAPPTPPTEGRPSGEAAAAHPASPEELAAKEKRLREWEERLAKREEDLDPDD